MEDTQVEPLLSVIRGLAENKGAQQSFAEDPAGYLASHGYGEISPQDLQEAFGLVADTLSPVQAEALAPAGAAGASEDDLVEAMQRLVDTSEASSEDAGDGSPSPADDDDNPEGFGTGRPDDDAEGAGGSLPEDPSDDDGLAFGSGSLQPEAETGEDPAFATGDQAADDADLDPIDDPLTGDLTDTQVDAGWLEPDPSQGVPPLAPDVDSYDDPAAMDDFGAF